MGKSICFNYDRKYPNSRTVVDDSYERQLWLALWIIKLWLGLAKD